MIGITKADKVLEIGTGSGTQTSEFGETGAEVHSVELEPWVDSTKIVGDYVFLHQGDGKQGLPEQAPFTAIVATCGVEQIPDPWIRQLSSEGGRMVVPIGSPECQKLTLFRKYGDELVPVRVAAYTRFSMMRDKPKPKPPRYQP